MANSIQTLISTNGLVPSESEPLQNVSVALTLTEQEIVALSSQGTRIGEYSPEKLIMFIANMMYNAKLRLNHSTGFTDETKMQQMIAMDLRKQFPGLMDEEIKKAVSMGLNGDFMKKPDELIIFSPANLVKWIKAYKESVKQPAMAKYISYSKKDEEKVPDLKEQLERFKEIFLFNVGRVRENPDYKIVDYGNAIYHRLEWLGLLNMSIERKQAIYLNELQQLLKNPGITTLEESRLFEEWKANPKEDNPYQKRLISACKISALTIYIKDLIEMEMDVEELVNEAIQNKLS